MTKRTSPTIHQRDESVSQVAFGRHFTAIELAGIWELDPTTVRRMFQDEPGVFKIGESNRRDRKRDYMTLRIPEAVALRVYEKRSR